MTTTIINRGSAFEGDASLAGGRADSRAEDIGPAPHEPPSREPPALEGLVFGRYVLGQQIGRGGMGVVFRAHDSKIGRDVALKLLLGGPYASTLARRLFKAEIRMFARLDHPNIVPIYEAGEHMGELYFTMKLLPSDLRSEIRRFVGDPDGAAALMKKIALAVRYLHQHNILHRDLKPANILLDGDNPPNPYVADFGVAKLLDEETSILRTSAVVGTPWYRAPEQAAGKSLTWTADVYSLGVILYELLVGEHPFRGDAEEVERARKAAPRDPHTLHTLNPRIDSDLARICMRCLEKDPDHRYPSAQALALALQRYLDGEPLEGAGRFKRALRWCEHHWVAAGLLVGILLFLVTITWRAAALVSEQEVLMHADARQANMHDAAMSAGSVLAQFRALGDAVEEAAASTALVGAMEIRPGKRREDALQAFCARIHRHFDGREQRLNLNGRPPFHLWFVLDNDGVILAQSSESKGETHIGAPYGWRDYAEGARVLAGLRSRSTHISKAFRSESDGQHKFAFSSPIYGRAGEPLGMVVAGVASTAYLGSMKTDDRRAITVLVAPRDEDRRHDPGLAPHIILRHPAFKRGEAVAVRSDLVMWVGKVDPQVNPLWPAAPDRVAFTDGYRDPVAETHREFSGRWSAGLAPVGNTGFVVIVQSPEREAVVPELVIARQLAMWVVFPAVPGAALFGFAAMLIAWRRRRRRRPQVISAVVSRVTASQDSSIIRSPG